MLSLPLLRLTTGADWASVAEGAMILRLLYCSLDLDEQDEELMSKFLDKES